VLKIVEGSGAPMYFRPPSTVKRNFMCKPCMPLRPIHQGGYLYTEVEVSRRGLASSIRRTPKRLPHLVCKGTGDA
jgi:hypothetical protein